jgi:hypothetical protein
MKIAAPGQLKLKEIVIMVFTDLEQLNKVLLLNPISNYARLQLDNYLVVEAASDEAEDFLTSLEYNEILPLTATWYSQEAMKVRIYQRPEDISTEAVELLGLMMSVRTGPDDRCLVSSPLVRLRDYNDTGDESLLEPEPAVLSPQALRVLRSLIFLSDCMWRFD